MMNNTNNNQNLKLPEIINKKSKFEVNNTFSNFTGLSSDTKLYERSIGNLKDFLRGRKRNEVHDGTNFIDDKRDVVSLPLIVGN